MGKSGFVAIIGRPNVGKSILVNNLLGMKIAAVSPWPQTTRKRQLGILTLDKVQLVFIDTPGIHKPLHKLGARMNEETLGVLEECDLILFVVDASVSPTPEDQRIADLLASLKHPVPVVLALNKIDQADSETLESNQDAYRDLIPEAAMLQLSATRGDNLESLVAILTEALPEGLPFYPEDQVTDLNLRAISADLIREAALYNLRDEVPHSLAVRMDEFKEQSELRAYIAATIYVERDSQKAIVIGRNGAMLKKIGTAARQQIEAMSGQKVYLRLRVKVQENWRNDEAALRRFGYGK